MKKYVQFLGAAVTEFLSSVTFQKRLLMLSALLAVSVVTVQAQGDELTTIQDQLDATNTGMRDLYLTLRNLIYVVCGVIGLAILPGKYQKMQSGDPDAGKSMLNWGGALVFVAVGAYVIQLIFFA